MLPERPPDFLAASLSLFSWPRKRRRRTKRFLLPGKPPRAAYGGERVVRIRTPSLAAGARWAPARHRTACIDEGDAGTRAARAGSGISFLFSQWRLREYYHGFLKRFTVWVFSVARRRSRKAGRWLHGACIQPRHVPPGSIALPRRARHLSPARGLAAGRHGLAALCERLSDVQPGRNAAALCAAAPANASALVRSASHDDSHDA